MTKANSNGSCTYSCLVTSFHPGPLHCLIFLTSCCEQHPVGLIPLGGCVWCHAHRKQPLHLGEVYPAAVGSHGGLQIEHLYHRQQRERRKLQTVALTSVLCRMREEKEREREKGSSEEGDRERDGVRLPNQCYSHTHYLQYPWCYSVSYTHYLQYPGLQTGSVMTTGCLTAVCLCRPR